ncbi:hypothetical protein FACS1894199_16430 [Bacteroidia bacterium]|nr:hypothetical protein FACS1894199_16430 [Bacteroidia bacterium]
MAFVLSMGNDAFWIENDSLFVDLTKHHATLTKINDELSRSDDEFILSFKSKYSNHFPPSFILLEITSFGALSRLYDNLKSGKAKKMQLTHGLKIKPPVTTVCIMRSR